MGAKKQIELLQSQILFVWKEMFFTNSIKKQHSF